MDDILNNFIVYSIFVLVHKQIKVLKDEISELSKTNYDLEKEVRLLDQHIGFLVTYKKAIEVQLPNLVFRNFAFEGFYRHSELFLMSFFRNHQKIFSSWRESMVRPYVVP